MVPCEEEFENNGNWDLSATSFCPEFRETDIMRGSYYTKRFSWLRLAVHRCDPNDLIKKGDKMVKKTCASREDQDKFFEDNILSVFINK